jgi:hypothetical protein
MLTRVKAAAPWPRDNRARSNDAPSHRHTRAAALAAPQWRAHAARADARRGGGADRAAPLQRCRRKFLRFFPDGFVDETYIAWERGYKWEAHQQWERQLDGATYRTLLRNRDYAEIAARTVGIEARTHLVFSFEKMALRDAVRPAAGARAFAQGLYDFIYGPGEMERRFERWCAVVARLPRKQSRVSTWPIATVFGFIARPDIHIFLKPNVTRRAALAYGFPFHYESRLSWRVYASLLDFAATVRDDLADLDPRDMIDIQSFLSVQGSDEDAE